MNITNLGFVFFLFNATFNNISVISWQSVLLVEDTRVLEKTTDLPQFTDKFYQTGYQLTTLVGMGTDCIGSWKSNHHMITMALQHTRPHNLKSEFQESFQLKHPFWTQMQDNPFWLRMVDYVPLNVDNGIMQSLLKRFHISSIFYTVTWTIRFINKMKKYHYQRKSASY